MQTHRWRSVKPSKRFFNRIKRFGPKKRSKLLKLKHFSMKENYDKAKLRNSGLWDVDAAKKSKLIVTRIVREDGAQSIGLTQTSQSV